MRTTTHRLILLFVIAAVVPRPALSGINEWTGGGPEGGSIHDIERDPGNAGHYYLGTTNGVFKSTDQGATWTRVANGANRTINDIAVADDGVIYALDQGETGHLFKSSDDAATWTELSVPAGDLQSVSVAPTNSSRIALVVGSPGEQNLYLSTDGGAMFVLAGTGLPDVLFQVAFDPTTDQIAYCAVQSGVFKTTDGGTTWTEVVSMNSTRTVTVSPSSPQTILAGNYSSIAVSTDGGATWSQTSDARGRRGVEIAPTDPLHMAALHTDEIYVSTDGGISWGPPVGDVDAGSNRSVVYEPTGVSTLFVASAYGVRKSVDGAASWSDSSSGINASSVWTSVAASSATTAYEFGGRLKSADAGDTWIASNTGLPLVSGTKVSVTADDPDHAVWIEGEEMFETDDGGATWVDISPSLFDAPNFNSIDLDPYDTERWILSNASLQFAQGEIDPALAISEDGGMSWQTRLQPDPLVWSVFYPWVAEFHPDDPDVLLATGSGVTVEGEARCWIRRSADGGVTWSEVFDIVLPSTCFGDLGVDPTDGQKAWHLMHSNEQWSLRRSLDSGQTWGDVPPPPFDGPYSIAVNPTNGDLYAGGDKLYRSVDGGDSWTSFSTHGLSEQVRFIGWVQISNTTPTTFWISTNAGVFSYTGSPDIFADGFESGDTSAWTATVP